MITTNNEVFNGLVKALVPASDFNLMMVPKVGPITSNLDYLPQWEAILKSKREEIENIEKWINLCKLANQLNVEFKEV